MNWLVLVLGAIGGPRRRIVAATLRILDLEPPGSIEDTPPVNRHEEETNPHRRAAKHEPVIVRAASAIGRALSCARRPAVNNPWNLTKL